jgi:EAL domain-containing protein (putative c-di-GMP-specific phosphodiesterase class I)
VLGRLPGNELVVAAFGSEPLDLVAERVEDRVAPLLLNLRSGSCLHRSGDQAEELLRKARLAHFVACRAPGKASETYDDEMDTKIGEEAVLLRDLLTAIDGDELALEYQPKVDLETQRLVGVEALARWPRRGGRSCLPNDFIWAAERSGTVVRLGRWALGQACRQAVQWRDAGWQPLRVAVNLSPLHFFRTDVVTDVRQALETHDLEPGWLELELTESTILGDDGVGAEVLEEIGALGVTLALDDFGTGQSSLSRLWRLPIHRLKIDRSFVQPCSSADRDRCLVRAIADIGKSLRIRVLAEGVETAEHLQFVQGAGCHEAQGSYFAQSLPPEGVAAFLQERGFQPG